MLSLIGYYLAQLLEVNVKRHMHHVVAGALYDFCSHQQAATSVLEEGWLQAQLQLFAKKHNLILNGAYVTKWTDQLNGVEDLMGYRDEKRTCIICGEEFVHTAGEHAWMKERFEEYIPPSRCMACRRKK